MAITLTEVSNISNQVLDEVERAIIGKRIVLEKIMAAILASGHILLEDFPGLGKTLMARSFATVLGLDFKRIQFTPDLLPGDITGGYIFNRAENRFDLRKGPIFANIALADEINRASPKTQSALLEAMQEGQVTLEGETLSLPEPFIVLATQNPIEYEGTFPLPEAQLDRFMLKLSVGYPELDDEREILHRRSERQQDEVNLSKVTNADALREIQQAMEDVHVDNDLKEYIAAIVHETRKARRVAVGASPRASLSFLKIARSYAVLQGRDYVLPDDIKYFAGDVLKHRIILQPEYWMSSKVTEDIIQDVFDRVPVPVVAEK
ncbi:MAG: MoxR family ATPase [Anaerolineae bacterium]|jgi:MoxR-like ATPase|nr:MoxR family ATPase [Anaerolineae bacterium]MBT7191090.1 MoxR family ATPase [Anaerolineae bacterium]MBT7988477.1 MoxR family ATPase [Anaerolineae bacterium]